MYDRVVDKYNKNQTIVGKKRMASYRVGTLFRIQKLYESTGFTDGAAFIGYRVCGRKAFWASDLQVLSYLILYFNMQK